MAIYKPIPIVDQTIWGSNRLNLQRDNSDQKGGTSWEVSFHEYGSNAVVDESGTLKDLLEKDQVAMIGSLDPNRVLRICYLDTKEQLSIQLHPTVQYAQEHQIGDYGKSESWYIIEAQPGSTIKAGTDIETIEELKANIENGSIANRMIEHPVKPGDFIYIPAGTLHALGAGIFAVEVGTNSNTTYRVFDYNRTDDQGHRRELHIDQVLATVDLGLKPTVISVEPTVNELYILTENEHFTVGLLEFDGSLEFELMGSPLYLTILDGDMTINSETFDNLDNLFVSGVEETLFIEGRGKLLISYTSETV